MEIGAWLRSLGLERYAPAFRENEIDWEALPKLTAEDLKDLGVVLGGHRRRLLDAIAALDTPEAPPPATTTPASVGEAERRQLTVMFCDLVGSTPLSTRFDPEDLREIVGAYHRCVADTVGRFGGFVAKYMGDGVLAFVQLSLALWHRGYPNQSARAADRALALSRQLGHAHTLAHALYFAGMAAAFARDVATGGAGACRKDRGRPRHPGPLIGIDRDRGTPRGATPATPPGIRVRTTVVRSG